MATRHWNVALGNWGTATNWLENAVPTSSDDVIVDNGGTCTVTATVQCNSFYLGSTSIINSTATTNPWFLGISGNNTTLYLHGSITGKLNISCGASTNTNVDAGSGVIWGLSASNNLTLLTDINIGWSLQLNSTFTPGSHTINFYGITPNAYQYYGEVLFGTSITGTSYNVHFDTAATGMYFMAGMPVSTQQIYNVSVAVGTRVVWGSNGSGGLINFKGTFSNAGTCETDGNNSSLSIDFPDYSQGTWVIADRCTVNVADFYNLNIGENNNTYPVLLGNDVTVHNNLGVASNYHVVDCQTHTLNVQGSITGPLTINNGATVLTTTSTANISGANTFYDFTSTTPLKTLAFQALTTQTVTHNFTITGASAQLISLISQTPSSPWTITTPTANANIIYAAVGDSIATNTLTANSSNDNGGNTNWIINSSIYQGILGSTSSFIGSNFEYSIFYTGDIESTSDFTGAYFITDHDYTGDIESTSDFTGQYLHENFYTGDIESTSSFVGSYGKNFVYIGDIESVGTFVGTTLGEHFVNGDIESSGDFTGSYFFTTEFDYTGDIESTSSFAGQTAQEIFYNGDIESTSDFIGQYYDADRYYTGDIESISYFNSVYAIGVTYTGNLASSSSFIGSYSSEATPADLETVRIDNLAIGKVSSYGVEQKLQISGADDVVLTADDTYMTCKVAGAVITVTEYDLNQNMLRSRSISFTVLAALTTSYSSLNFVQYQNMHYLDSQEFVLRLGTQAFLLKESQPQYFANKYSNLTPYFITASGTYNSYAVFGTADGKVFSMDTSGNYKYADGTGSGAGPFNGGTVLGNSQINAIVQYGTQLVIVGGADRVGSFDGVNWRNYDGSGTGSGIYENGTVLGGVGLNAAYVYGTTLIIAGGSGRVGSYYTGLWHAYSTAGTGFWNTGTATNGQAILSITAFGTKIAFGAGTGLVASFDASVPAWTNYNAGSGLCNNQTAIGLSNVLSEVVYANTLVIAGTGGRVASFDGTNWKNYDGSGSGTGAFNIGTAVGTSDITDMWADSVTLYVLAGAQGRIASYAVGNWSNYNNITSFALFDNNTLLPPNSYPSGGYTTGQWTNVVVVGTAVIGGVYVIVGSGLYHTSPTTTVYYNLVSSYDGTAWKKWDGTGLGTGPYLQEANLFANSQTVGGVYSAYSAATGKYYLMLTPLQVAQVASWDGSHWKYATGAGTGTGPYSTQYGTAVGCSIYPTPYISIPNQGAILQANPGDRYIYFMVTSLYCGGAAFSTWDSATGLWHYNDGSGGGSGQYANYDYSVLGGGRPDQVAGAMSPIYTAGVYAGRYIAVFGWGGAGTGSGIFYSRCASWDITLGAWKKYDGSGTGTGPYNPNMYNGTGGSVTFNAIQYGNALVVTNGYGNLASYDGSNWRWQDGTGIGTGPYNQGTYWGSTVIRVIAYNNFLIVGAYAPRGTVSSWDGLAWKYGDGTGTGSGPYLNDVHYPLAAGAAAYSYPQIYKGIYVDCRHWLGIYGGSPAHQEVDEIILSYVFSQKLWVYCNTTSFGSSSGTGFVKSAFKALDFGAASQQLTWNGRWLFSGGSNAVFDYDPVANIWENTYNNKNVPQQFFGISGPAYSVQYNQYLIYAVGTDISSYDGTNWKFYDGTGTGTGPYNSNVLNGNPISALVVYNGMLIVGGSGGQIGSFDGANWVTSTGTGSGIGPYNNATVISADTVTVMIVYSNVLVVAGAAGRLGSYDGVWHNYNAGSGITNNQTVIGANSINTLTQYVNALIVAGAGGLLGYWSGTAWHNYNGGDPLANNATAIGGNAITYARTYQNSLVVAGVGGRIASYDGSAWHNYNSSGTGLWNNATVVGAIDVAFLVSYSGNLIVASTTGNVGSFDGTNWRNYDGSGTGTGPYLSSQTQQGNASAVLNNTRTVYNSVLTVMAQYAPYVVVNNSLLFPQPVDVQVLTLPQTRLAQVFAYRFENGYYLYGITNNVESVFYSLATNAETSVLTGRYAVMQVSNGFSRALVSGLAITSGNNIYAFGTYGYSDFTNFNDYVQYTGATVAFPPFVLQQSIYVGGVDITYKTSDSAANIYNFYAPQFQNTQTSIVTSNQSQSNTLINAYGKIINAYGLAPEVPFEIRVGLVNGQQSYLSAALLDGSTDNLGVLLTENGDFDDSYIPQTYQFSISCNLLYKYNNIFSLLVIGKNVDKPFSKISSTLYKINTLSPNNLVDTSTQSLIVSSMDYNGRMLFTSNQPPSVVATTVANIIQTPFSNSLDTGDKLVHIANLNNSNYAAIAFRIPLLFTTVPNYEVDTYLNDVYYSSTLNDGSEVADPNKIDQEYIETTNEPLAIGDIYVNGVVQTTFSTIFLLPSYNGSNGYDGYVYGNSVDGIFTPFILYGQVYLFDGFNVYLADIQNNIFNSKTQVAPAGGMQLIASAPTEVYFLSNFDNSLYSFQGGRDLTKKVRMNKLESVENGVWSTLDNALLLNTANTLIWVRDGIVTLNQKIPEQLITHTVGHNPTFFSLYNTTKGIYLGNDLYNWIYTYEPIAGSTIVPFSWQSAYYGMQANEKSVLVEYTITFYDNQKSPMTVLLKYYSFNEDREYPVVNRVYNVTSNMYTTDGLLRLSYKPKQQLGLASSIALYTTNKVNLLDVTQKFTQAGDARITSQRSR